MSNENQGSWLVTFYSLVLSAAVRQCIYRRLKSATHHDLSTAQLENFEQKCKETGYRSKKLSVKW